MRLVLLFVATICLSSGSSAVPMAPHPDDVSMVALIANPAAYDGKRVRVTGFAVFEFEMTALYLSKKDAALGLNENSIALDTRRPLADLQKLNGRHVFVAGIFKTTQDGKRGYVESIETLEPVVPLRRFPAAETE